MSALDSIKQPIKTELKEFDAFFKNEMKSDTALLNLITAYVLRTKGKQIRPILVFLSAKLHGETNKSSYSAAFLVELMHTATLIHDDVVDASDRRRGVFSVNALWKNKIAVLIGDYFLAKGLLHAVDNTQFRLLQIVSEAVREMSEGELLQIEKARMLNLDEATYFEIIRKKTATLLAAAVIAGACSTGACEEQMEKMRELGTCLGIAFQIKDDIFDYEMTSLIGKPTGNDIKEQKITLPLLYVISKADAKTKKWIYSVVKRHNTNSKKVSELIDYVKNNGGIEYAIGVMNDYRNRALAVIDAYPEGESKTAFRALIQYVIDREK